MRKVTAVEAQYQFGELLETAQHEPVTITRRGRSIACLVSVSDMEELLELRKQAFTKTESLDLSFA
jgi:prevent-host-death family protein